MFISPVFLLPALPAAALHGEVMKVAQYKAMEYELDPYVGKAIFAIIIFICGISVDTDPLFITLTRNLEKGAVAGMLKEQALINRLKSLVSNNLRNIEEHKAKRGAR